MGRKCGDRTNLARANADRFAAVTAVFRGKHESVLHAVVVALGPAIVAAGLQKHQLFSWQRSFFFGFVEFWPVRMQLVSPVLGNKQSTRGVEGKTLRVTYPRCVAISGGKHLVRFVGVIVPDAATSLKFGTRIVAGYLGLPVLRLARIGRGSNVHVHGSIGTDDKRMHGMIATERQLRNDRFRGILWNDGVGGTCISHNAI